MASVTLTSLTKSFDDTPVVKGIDLTVHDGEFFSLLGPSGCGKTTILRMIAGFTFPTSGSISFDKQDVSFIPVNRRNTGMVFQNYALFPHMTVFENVAFGLKTRKVEKSEIEGRVASALDLVGLEGLQKRPVPQLSGGQQQRVALARAVVIEPALLLLDEPLSNLDAKLREETRDQIRDLQRQLKITTIYVTHDQEEALAVSDRIAVMNEGVCQQLDTPDMIYQSPANRFVAQFMGKMNLLEGSVNRTDETAVFHAAGGLSVILPGPVPESATPCLAVRPQSVSLTLKADADTTTGKIKDRQFKGASIEYLVETGGAELIVIEGSKNGTNYRVGDPIEIRIVSNEAILLTE
jgi:iron(III) transport system ATP-binding protein